MPTNLSATTYEKWFRALFVGPTGRGKTIAAASWPGKTLVIDFDDRHRPIIDWFPDRLSDYDIESIHADNFWTVLKPLMNRLRQLNPYTNIICDGITSMSNTTIMTQMMIKGGFENWFQRSKEDTKGSKITAGGIMVPGWDEFNGEAMLMSLILEMLRSFKCNLFVTAHPVARTRIEGTKAVKYSSLVTFGPKIESIIPTYFDEVWYFDYEVVANSDGTTRIKRTVHTAPSDDYMEAKTALKVPAVIDYTDKNLYDLVKEYLATKELVV